MRKILLFPCCYYQVFLSTLNISPIPRDSVGKINDILIGYRSSGCGTSSHSNAGAGADST